MVKDHQKGGVSSVASQCRRITQTMETTCAVSLSFAEQSKRKPVRIILHDSRATALGRNCSQSRQTRLKSPCAAEQGSATRCSKQGPT